MAILALFRAVALPTPFFPESPTAFGVSTFRHLAHTFDSGDPTRHISNSSCDERSAHYRRLRRVFRPGPVSILNGSSFFESMTGAVWLLDERTKSSQFRNSASDESILAQLQNTQDNAEFCGPSSPPVETGIMWSMFTTWLDKSMPQYQHFKPYKRTNQVIRFRFFLFWIVKLPPRKAQSARLHLPPSCPDRRTGTGPHQSAPSRSGGPAA